MSSGQLVREWDDTPEDFGRVAATTARQVIVQRLRDASSDITYGEFAGHEREVMLGLVQHHEQRAGARIVMVDLGKGFEAILPPAEQVPGERYEHGDRIRVCVASVSRTPRGVSVTVSRTHPELVRGMFALEVPEIADGTVEIAAIAREAGHRTKIAVRTRVPGSECQGGPLRSRGAHACVPSWPSSTAEIDIVDWSDDPARFVASALSPAKVSSVQVVDTPCGPPASSCRITSFPWPSARRAERPPRRPAHRVGALISTATPSRRVRPRFRSIRPAGLANAARRICPADGHVPGRRCEDKAVTPGSREGKHVVARYS